jgi:hypothetical protein
MLKKMFERFQEENISRIIDFIIHNHNIDKEKYRNILINEEVHSFSVVPYIPNDNHYITVSIIYQNHNTSLYYDLGTTFKLDDYFNWYKPIDRKIKIEKLKSKYEHLVN